MGDIYVEPFGKKGTRSVLPLRKPLFSLRNGGVRRSLALLCSQPAAGAVGPMLEKSRFFAPAKGFLNEHKQVEVRARVVFRMCVSGESAGKIWTD